MKAIRRGIEATCVLLIIVAALSSGGGEATLREPTQAERDAASGIDAAAPLTVEVAGATLDPSDDADLFGAPEVAVSSVTVRQEDAPTTTGVVEPAPTTTLAPQRLALVNVPVGVNLRRGPAATTEVLAGVLKDRTVISTGRVDGDWTEVTVDGQTGWMWSGFLAPAEAE